jgi:hypothetical protein
MFTFTNIIFKEPDTQNGVFETNNLFSAIKGLRIEEIITTHGKIRVKRKTEK